MRKCSQVTFSGLNFWIAKYYSIVEAEGFQGRTVGGCSGVSMRNPSNVSEWTNLKVSRRLGNELKFPVGTRKCLRYC